MSIHARIPQIDSNIFGHDIFFNTHRVLLCAKQSYYSTLIIDKHCAAAAAASHVAFVPEPHPPSTAAEANKDAERGIFVVVLRFIFGRPTVRFLSSSSQ